MATLTQTQPSKLALDSVDLANSVVHPVLNIPPKQQASLLSERTQYHGEVPSLHLNTIDFRVRLLRKLREGWKNDETEARFLEIVSRVDSDGAALFGGLIDPAKFEKLIEAYDKVQAQAGNAAFMHSYINLALQHDFFLGGDYIEAFSHPLLVSVVSYLVGGAIRIVEFRGKNTDPISINAQDNMLHVDNTPFKEEYKVLLNWRRGQVKGPSGQNFTFLPWTHKGNRAINFNSQGEPWSSERDSLFVTDESIDGLFEFQKRVKGVSRVVEARHPDQPLSCLFPAGALVHQRYRTEDGDPRSCIITAFHLSKKHPGHISELPPVTGRKKTLIEFLVGHQDEGSDDEFLDVLLGESPRVEDKLEELFQPDHPSKLIETASLALSDDRLAVWRETVKHAPSPIVHKLNNGLRLSEMDFSNLETLTEKLAAVMDYDKHCNLQMILYEDGREEIRKPGRKIIGERKKDAITKRLGPWLSDLGPASFSASDMIEPQTLRILCDAVAELAGNLTGVPSSVSNRTEEWNNLTGQTKIFGSLSRLMTDLGEAITRTEGIEAFVVTSLFLFLASEEIYSHLSSSDKTVIRFVIVLFLRNYIAAVLLVESNMS
ncbi:hypothetical protein F5B22DRAFT_662014 [Xylaria bambusicola]|uniref:uncharacterized protein n=1 Tax=Xylaria bambusicola TaxID=326684 RepID=UPI00200774AE|nr:uncharacterized protein F5B22DRAFT_662014 [Xylaria bambusicola]KAI0521683.1 hypothetical protein F5B22DRAFT_662014 [Xylaria bambusicola]